MANPSKKQGASFEARFTADAIARGFDVLEPAGDYLGYDRIAVNDRGETFRVQVKGTSYKQKGKQSYKILAATGRGGLQKNILTVDDADILALYVEPVETWYMIPIEKLTSKSVLVSPSDEKSVGRYETWREAWNVFA
jgi:hypothetical protein